MMNKKFKNGMIIGLIILFLGASILPSINWDIKKINDVLFVGKNSEKNYEFGKNNEISLSPLNNIIGDYHSFHNGSNRVINKIISGNHPNNPPNKPDLWRSDTCLILKEGQRAGFWARTTDPDDDWIYYNFSWGDGSYNWVGPYPSSGSCHVSHIWNKAGNYEVKVMAMDENQNPSEWSDSLIISVVKHEPPTKPSISGPTIGKPEVTYCWTFKSDDLNPCERVYYIIEWGDDTTVETDWYYEGTPVEECHRYTTKGIYLIRAKAIECEAPILESDWATLSVSMPKSKLYKDRPFLQFLQQHPLIYQLLQRLLKL